MRFKKRYAALGLLGLLLATLVFFIYGPDLKKVNVVATKDRVQQMGVSVFHIPIEIDINSFEGEINHHLDSLGWIYEEKDLRINNELSISYKVKKREEFKLTTDSSNIHIHLPLHIKIDGKVKAPIAIPINVKEEMFADVNVNSIVKLEQKANWDVATTIKTSYEIIRAPEARILGKTISFRKQLEESLAKALPTINKMLEDQLKNNVQTQSVVNRVWQMISRPMALSNDPVNVWANLNPGRPNITQPENTNSGVLASTIGFKSTLKLQVGGDTSKTEIKDLPGARIVDSVEAGYSTLNFPLMVDIDSFMDFLNNEVGEQTIQIPKRTKPLILKNFSAEPDGEYVNVIMDYISGSLNGKLHVMGRPVFNKAEEKIVFRNLRFNSESNKRLTDKLLRAVEGKTGLLNKVKEKLYYDIKPQKEKLIFDISNSLRSRPLGKYAMLKGYINDITVHDVYINDNFIVLPTTVTANIKCVVSGNNKER